MCEREPERTNKSFRRARAREAEGRPTYTERNLESVYHTAPAPPARRSRQSWTEGATDMHPSRKVIQAACWHVCTGARRALCTAHHGHMRARRCLPVRLLQHSRQPSYSAPAPARPGLVLVRLARAHEAAPGCQRGGRSPGQAVLTQLREWRSEAQSRPSRGKRSTFSVSEALFLALSVVRPSGVGSR